MSLLSWLGGGAQGALKKPSPMAFIIQFLWLPQTDWCLSVKSSNLHLFPRSLSKDCSADDGASQPARAPSPVHETFWRHDALDLVYVTPRIIVMGLPWNARTERKSHRNNRSEVRAADGGRCYMCLLYFDNCQESGGMLQPWRAVGSYFAAVYSA
jgi:hypothetical protein